MKNFFLVFFLLLTTVSLAQERGTYQPDSIYKANRVKSRQWYLGTTNKLYATTFYDTDGRIIIFQLEPSITGVLQKTYFTYDSIGKLVAMVDTITNGAPDQEAINTLKKVGVDIDKIIKDSPNKPPLEIGKYDLIYAGDQLITVTEYNSNGSIKSIKHIEDNGKKETKDIYINGKIRRQNITQYLTKFHKKNFSGWEINEGEKSKWNYTFTYIFENGQVKSITRYEGKVEQETCKYIYNTGGLLITIIGNPMERFGYTYY